jgi:5'(3')-deoxyribonucleotidase
VSSGFILGVDLDGVCGDHAMAFKYVVASERSIEPAALPDQQTWNFTEWGLNRAEFEALHRRAVLKHRMFRTMPVITGCAESLWRLSDAGVSIRIITHRLYTNWGHSVAVSDTVEWLDKNSIPYRDLCFMGEKTDVAADAYIDDAPHNVIALRAVGASVLTFSQPYNREVEGSRAEGWADAEQWVLDEISRTGRTVEPSLNLATNPRTRLASPVTHLGEPGLDKESPD